MENFLCASHPINCSICRCSSFQAGVLLMYCRTLLQRFHRITVVKVEDRDDTGGFLKTRLQKVKELCATIPNAYWTNQYGNLDAIEAHYELTATEICADFDSLDYVFIGVSTAGTIAGVSRRLKEHYPNIRVIAVDTEGSAIFG